MFKQTTLASAIVAAIASNPAHAATIEEVTVTATKRAESTQDIPVAVSAMGEEKLEQMGVSNFQDYMVQMPGITAGGSGPGQNTIYIRGVASTTPNLTTAGVAGLAPNVALYLDEQPLSQPGRNLDVYAADLNRVEVLAGPQGTLFGASSQAGTVRLITNKPDPTDAGGNIKVGTSFTSGGEPSQNLEAVANLPLTNTLTLRGVVYVDHQGGYIDNVAGTRSAAESARFRPEGTMRDNGVAVSARRAGFQANADLSDVTFLEADNADLVQKDFNDTTYTGGRLSGLWDINQDWSLLVGYAQQTIDSDGVFFVDPDLDDMEIQRFSEDSLEDSYQNVNWTLEGRLAELEMVYTGAFTKRDSDQLVDYSDYLFVGQYLPYYICDGSVSYPGDAGPSGTCQAPNLFVDSTSEAEVSTHELRFSTPDDKRIHATFGAFYSDMELRERNDFTYPGSTLVDGYGVQTGFSPNYPFETGYTSDDGPFPDGVIFRNDVKRTDKQMGVFGEVTFELSEAFSAIVGSRYYDIEVDFEGSANSSFCNLFQPDVDAFGTDISDLYNGDGEYTFHGSCDPSQHITYTADTIDENTPDAVVAALQAPDVAATDGTIFKFTLQWMPTDDYLLYATASEGFRPGLLNRPGGAAGPGDYTVPFALDTDDTTNYELGWKTDLLDGQLRFNGSLFFVDIEKLQTTIFDPSITNLFFSDNAANAEVKGVEGDFTWAPEMISGLLLSGSFSVLDTEITEVLTPTDDVRVGDELAFAPKFQANLQARYEWDGFAGSTYHVMPHVTYSESSYTDIISINRMELDSWAMLGLTAGITTDKWSAEFFGKNLTDERAELSGNFVFDRSRVSVSRPRTFGLRGSYHF
ncbi:MULTISPECIES: TonB-dependent receptor [unclassified Microbulbifer]|uniref:TonB-dependent receptor n=1 Tax=unclassified Microbulbifer TaxID=2619833 RepID=UPI0027E5BBE2|nr:MULTISPECIES: TonB-dependent receptor [unclassified Microbulbifer]